HSFGGVVSSLAPLSIGVPLIILPRFQPAAFLATIQKHNIAVRVPWPSGFFIFVTEEGMAEYDLSSLRNILLGAAPVSTELILDTGEKLRKRGAKDLEITQAFRLTEITYVINILQVRSRIGSIGILLPNQEARLVDEDENDVNEGERGELWIRGDNIMKGYLHNEEATRNAITPDGWFKRGNIATRDSEDFYAIADRKKELIKRGKAFPPAELEALLISHPDVADSGVIDIFLSPKRQSSQEFTMRQSEIPSPSISFL
ncbi:hypothetical protein BS47DRAFT_1414760, partial [Hydnum rufescens UP504]